MRWLHNVKGQYAFGLMQVAEGEQQIEGFQSLSIHNPETNSGSIEVDSRNLEPGETIQYENLQRLITLHTNAGTPCEIIIAGYAGDATKPEQEETVILNNHMKAEKPWGYELWLNGEAHDHFNLKWISIKAGTETSLHYHNYKHETGLVYRGNATLQYCNRENVTKDDLTDQDLAHHELSAGDVVTVQPGARHRIITQSDIVYVEVATARHPDFPGLLAREDVVRVADGSNRGDGKIEAEYGEQNKVIKLYPKEFKRNPFVFIATDVDGTLAIVGHKDGVPVDAYAFGEACVAVLCKQHPGLDEDICEEFRQFGQKDLPGKSYEDSYKLLMTKAAENGLDIPDIQSDNGLRFFKDEFDKLFSCEIPKSSTVREAVVQAVCEIEDAGTVVMAVSNSGEPIVLANLEKCQMGHLHNVITADHVHVSKPEPDMYETMFHDMRDMMSGAGEKENITMLCLEDSMTGFKSAIAASIELQKQGFDNPIEVMAVPLDSETHEKMMGYAKGYPEVAIQIFQPEKSGNRQLKHQLTAALTPPV